MRLTAWIAALSLVALPVVVRAEAPVDYLKDIKPVLAARCFGCHSARKHEHELRLDAASLIFKGGAGGPIIEVGKSDDSLLIDAVTGAAGVSKMPPEGEPLTPVQIAKLKKWIDQGAVAPRDEPIPADPSRHWSYLPPVKRPLPTVRNPAWQQNPVDAFLGAEHDKRGLQHAAAAPKNLLLRRLYIDLIGLPPTQAELQDFLADQSPQAYERVVDRLLASPQYGERWARHWMDVWRYSDWDGFGKEIRESQPHIWRWRDWIIDSLNADKGYDRMVQEMVAGDEIAPGDPDTVRATGFLVRNWYKFNRNVWLDYTVEHTSKAFLATTVNCSRCHHHMYDPIEQPDYYSFRAIFEPHDVRTDRLGAEKDTTKDGVVRAYDLHLQTPTYLFHRGNEKQPEKEKPLAPGLSALFSRWGEFKIEPVKLPLEIYYPGMRPAVQQQMRDDARKEVADAQQALSKASVELGIARQKLKEKPVEKPADPKVVAKAPAKNDPKPGAKQPAASATDPAAAAKKLEEAVQGAERTMVIAEKQLVIALTSQNALEARITAENAKYAKPVPANANTLARAAGKLDRELNLRKTELQLLQAKNELAIAKRDFVPTLLSRQRAIDAAEKKIKDSQKSIEQALTIVHQPTETYATLGPTYPAESSGRRLALARWMTARGNPLTARVAINHIWLRHFGSPLVATMFDFGHNGKAPSHPELLDWLAVDLMEHGWSTKHIHRLLVTSQAYRMLTTTAPELASTKSRDPDNRFLWRMNARRMEAEAVRDGMLTLSGQLDRSQHGPDIDNELGLKNFRRSLYFRSAKEKKVLFLSIFDSPNVTDCYRRSETVVPQQALAMVNSSLTLEQSRRLAGKLSQEVGTADQPQQVQAFIRNGFQQILCRAPSAQEEAECRQYLREVTRQFRDGKGLTKFEGPVQTTIAPSTDPHQRAREGLVLVLLNHNDFVTVR